MTRLERLTKEREQVYRLYQQACTGATINKRARKLSKKLALLDLQIDEAQRYEPRRMSEVLDRKTLADTGLCECIIRAHLAADYCNDCFSELRERMGKAGLAWCNLFDIAQDVEKSSAKFANFIATPEFQQLCDFICSDDELIDAMHAVVTDYMKARLCVVNSYETEQTQTD